MTLATIDPSSALAVTSYLEQAKTWLATAVENTGPEQIAMKRAEITTAADAAKHLHLSKDIQLDAEEMVRRAEYTLARSIRLAQADGSIRSLSDNAAIRDDPGGVITRIPSVKDIAPDFYYNGSQMAVMADHASPEQFDSAIEEAKAEGNLSRANVVRKIKCGTSNAQPTVITRDMRAEMIRALAEQGHTSRDMTAKVGVSDITIREIARDFDIDIPADKVIGLRRIDHTQTVDNTVTALENTVSALQYIDLAKVEFGQADEWIASLAASISALNGFKKRLAKEATQ